MTMTTPLTLLTLQAVLTMQTWNAPCAKSQPPA